MGTFFCCAVRDPASVPVSGALEAVARACSPSVELHGEDVVVFDATGLTRVLGPPPVIAREVIRLAADRGVVVRAALARTTTAAWLLAHARPGATVVPPGGEAAALAELAMSWLAVMPQPDPEVLATLQRWGLRTLGELAQLLRADVHARLGSVGVRMHQAACGEDATPLVPAGEKPRFVERLELEWPIEGLEPLSFVLARLCDALAASLEQADRGAVTVTTRLRLVTRAGHERALHLPAPMRDARVLRTLILLDLESHPPDAAIDVVEVEVEVTRGRIVQGSLLARSLPSAEDLATLIARLGALMGERRVGAPALVDTHDERSCTIAKFRGGDQGLGHRAAGAQRRGQGLVPCLRRYRLPITARVIVEGGKPMRVEPAARGLAGGRVVACAGPWRTSGRWWALDRTRWERDEWDVELADGGVYRLARHRLTGQWEIDGVAD
jgi:protein ImuB